MAIDAQGKILGPPRITELTKEGQVRSLLAWMFSFYEGVSTVDPDRRLIALETRMSRIENQFVILVQNGTLNQPISNPPTQAEVQNIQQRLNDVIADFVLPSL